MMERSSPRLRGYGAKGAIADISTNFANASNAISQNAADAKSNAALAQGAILNNTIGGVLKAAGTVAPSLFGSSYGGSGSTTPYGDGTNLTGGIFRRRF